MSTDLKLLYVTAKDRTEALRIAKAIVTEQLAACVNILGPISTLYWWEGALQEGEEVALVVKAHSAQVEPLVARIRALHSYECPCVMSLPIDGGNPQFLEWIKGATDRL